MPYFLLLRMTQTEQFITIGAAAPIDGWRDSHVYAPDADCF